MLNHQQFSEGLAKGWKRLVAVDRHDGVEIGHPLEKPIVAEIVAQAAKKAGFAIEAAWEVLFSGGHLSTAGFVYMLSKDESPCVSR